MIVYGLTMQEKPEVVPDEVAVWLLERNDRYPNIEFNINCSEPTSPEQVEEYKLGVRYSRLYHMRGPAGHVMSVTFPYANQSWNIRIVGGLTKDGKIANLGKDEDTTGLTAQLRQEIAGLPDNTEKVHRSEDGWVTLGTPVAADEPSRKEPVEFIPLPADGRWTSELTMSGAEILDLVEGPVTERKEALVQAISEKDWETARRLLKQRH